MDNTNIFMFILGLMEFIRVGLEIAVSLQQL